MDLIGQITWHTLHQRLQHQSNMGNTILLLWATQATPYFCYEQHKQHHTSIWQHKNNTGNTHTSIWQHKSNTGDIHTSIWQHKSNTGNTHTSIWIWQHMSNTGNSHSYFYRATQEQHHTSIWQHHTSLHHTKPEQHHWYFSMITPRTHGEHFPTPHPTQYFHCNVYCMSHM